MNGFDAGLNMHKICQSGGRNVESESDIQKEK